MTNHKEMVGFYALLTFAGLRPSEGERVEWKDYSFETKELHVKKGKVHARHIKLDSVAQEWMQWVKDNTPKGSPFIIKVALSNRQKEIREAVFGKNWIQDGLRHGFSTYYNNKIQDIAKVAQYMGNSVGIIKKHYARTLPAKEVESFWKLTPPVVLTDDSKGNGSSIS